MQLEQPTRTCKQSVCLCWMQCSGPCAITACAMGLAATCGGPQSMHTNGHMHQQPQFWHVGAPGWPGQQLPHAIKLCPQCHFLWICTTTQSSMNIMHHFHAVFAQCAPTWCIAAHSAGGKRPAHMLVVVVHGCMVQTARTQALPLTHMPPVWHAVAAQNQQTPPIFCCWP